MTKSKATVKGHGPELFGRGIDLLFGEEGTGTTDAPSIPAVDSVSQQVPEASANGSANVPVFTEADVDQFLRMAAEAFLRVQEQRRRQVVALNSTRGTSVNESVISTSVEPDPGDELIDLELAIPPLPANPAEVQDEAMPSIVLESSENAATQPAASFTKPDPAQEIDLDVPPLPEADIPAERPLEDQPAVVELDVVESQSPPVAEDSAVTEDSEMPENPNQPEATNQPVVSENGQSKKVAPPGVTVSGPVTALNGGQAKPDEGELSSSLVDREAPAMTRKEIEEILQRLPKSDLRSLDKQIDQLYEDVTVLFSGRRREITVAFEVLRKARIILLKDPEQYAEAEYLVRQVQARVHQVRQSIDQGGRYWPKLLFYQAIWLIVLSIMALVTTVNGAAFAGWLAYLLGVPVESETLGWAVLFISTLAWGGIGGATSALWSLYYHISVQRDYEPVENLWYYTQPLIGMVLGGIIFLIMGSGFLVVNADPSTAEGAMGARLIPAVIAVVAGFRQTVVLDLIDRIVGLIAPSKAEPSSEITTEESTI